MRRPRKVQQEPLGGAPRPREPAALPLDCPAAASSPGEVLTRGDPKAAGGGHWRPEVVAQEAGRRPPAPLDLNQQGPS